MAVNFNRSDTAEKHQPSSVNPVDSGLQNVDRNELLKPHHVNREKGDVPRAVHPDGKLNFDQGPDIFASVHDKHKSGTANTGEQKTQDQVRQVRESFQSGLPGVQNPDATIKSSVETANALSKAPPEDQQKIFSNAAGKFVKDNPKAETWEFTSLLGASLNTIPDAHQSVQLDQALGILQDSKAKTDKNPSGITATEFLGTGNKSIDTYEKSVYDTEQLVAKDVKNGKTNLKSDEQISAEISDRITKGAGSLPTNETGAEGLKHFDERVMDLFRELRTD